MTLSGGTDPPTEFQLFPIGEIATTKGTFVLTPEDAQACVADQAEYGNDLSIDYGHGVFREDEGVPQRAAGWIGGLEVRAGALWAVRVTWTPTAASMLRNREQRYISPTFDTTEEGRVVRILNVALTLMPATHNLTPLVASRRDGRTRTTRKLMSKKLNASHVEQMAADYEKMAEGDGSDAEKAMAKAMAAKLRKLADEAVDDEKKEPDGDEGKGGKGDGDGDEAKATSQAASRIFALARQVTGEDDPSRVEGALRAMKDNSSSVTALSRRVAELEAEQSRGRVESFVKLHATPGPNCKVTPAEVDDLVAWGMKDEKAMRAYVEKKSTIVAASSNHSPGSPTAGQGASGLTDDERKVIKLSGFTEDEWLKAKAKSA